MQDQWYSTQLEADSMCADFLTAPENAESESTGESMAILRARKLHPVHIMCRLLALTNTFASSAVSVPRDADPFPILQPSGRHVSHSSATKRR